MVVAIFLSFSSLSLVTFKCSSRLEGNGNLQAPTVFLGFLFAITLGVAVSASALANADSERFSCFFCEEDVTAGCTAVGLGLFCLVESIEEDSPAPLAQTKETLLFFLEEAEKLNNGRLALSAEVLTQDEVAEAELTVVFVDVSSAAVVVVAMVVGVVVVLEELNWFSAIFKAENIFEQAVFWSCLGELGVPARLGSR